ncbi:DGQHR domain-containing protein DpdB, partial [Actinokineospora inagensis]|uniref:DGQHR domain-containing protein DpdB n=1 Tax=Actinokineospora inagensis TaxID=103730 RepID=UPI000478FEF6
TLRLPALEVRQGRRRIYCFAVDGKKLPGFAAVSRVRRDEGEELQGYQRPEVLSHIRAIRRYLESDGAMLPNAIVVAFDKRVEFVPAVMQGESVDYSVMGELVIPVDEGQAEERKPAWLVDGQQRSAAIRDANIRKFPVAVVGFIADTEDEQRSQFILVNSTKALPKGLIHELLPGATGHLPPVYARKQLPAAIMARLNDDPTGPFHGAIATPTTPGGYIKDNSVLKMIENSITNGALHQYRDPTTGAGDLDRITTHLTTWWTAVRDTWPAEWALPPRLSRLTHGVGIVALGYAMDLLTDDHHVDTLDPTVLRGRLAELVPHTAWTRGEWQFRDGARRWNSIQNTTHDISALTAFLTGLLTPDRR